MRAVFVVHVAAAQAQVDQMSERNHGAADAHRDGMQDHVFMKDGHQDAAQSTATPGRDGNGVW